MGRRWNDGHVGGGQAFDDLVESVCILGSVGPRVIVRLLGRTATRRRVAEAGCQLAATDASANVCDVGSTSESRTVAGVFDARVTFSAPGSKQPGTGDLSNTSSRLIMARARPTRPVDPELRLDLAETVPAQLFADHVSVLGQPDRNALSGHVEDMHGLVSPIAWSPHSTGTGSGRPL